jgi:hypothetical protein
MTVYDQTIKTVRALAARAGTAEDVLFCEQRPLTSLEATFAGVGVSAGSVVESSSLAIQGDEPVEGAMR